MSQNKRQIFAFLALRFNLKRIGAKKLAVSLIFPAFVAVFIAVLGDNSKFQDSIVQFCALGMIPLARNIVIFLVDEKSSGQYDLMKINGLQRWPYKISFLLYGLTMPFLNNLFNLIGFVLCGNIEAKDLLGLMVAYTLTSLQIAVFGMFYSTLFKEPGEAGDTLGLGMVFCTFFFRIPVMLGIKAPIQVLMLSFFPTVGLSFAVINSFKITTMELGGFSFGQSLLGIAASTIIYFVLYLILDARAERKKHGNVLMRRVAPDSGSVSLTIEARQSKAPLLNNTNSPNYINLDSVKNVTSALNSESILDLENVKNVVFIDGLTKKFGDITVVDNLTIGLNEREVFCFLGHNGAGKSTTINMLTGLLNQDSGNIYYEGYEFISSFNRSRQLISLCPQKDLIFPDFTADENLRFVGMLRGLSEDEIEDEMIKIKQKVDLPSFVAREHLAGTLSGGQKRKLCLGMALLGNPKVIFMDEPTSGMDPDSRRTIWKIIRELRDEGKCIVLTTHHLEEADELSDRIAVLVKGKIFAQGSPNYIKKEFGVGYHLVLQPRTEAQSKEFISRKASYLQTISSLIKGSTPVKYSAENVLNVTLPFTETHRFPELFETLEKDANLRINLEMNSLEDAFVNISNNEEMFMNPELYSKRSRKELKNESAAVAPLSVKTAPSYDFKLQLKAMFLRFFVGLWRQPKFILLVLIPAFILVFGLFVVSSMAKAGDSQSLANAYTYLILFVNVVTSFGLSPICGYIVQEKEQKIRYALNVMGCRRLPYWLGTYFFSLIIGVIWVTMLIIAFCIDRPPLFTDTAAAIWFIVAYALYFNGLLIFTFVVSVKYNNSTMAFRYYGVTVYSLGAFSFVLEAIAVKNIVALWVVRFISYLFFGPFLCFADSMTIYFLVPITIFIIAMFSLAAVKNPASNFDGTLLGEGILAFGQNFYIGYVGLILLCCLYVYLLKISDNRRVDTKPQNTDLASSFEEMENQTDSSQILELNSHEGEYEQSDMNQEINRLNSIANRDNVTVTDLKKVYVSKNRIEGVDKETMFWAVKGVSFGVEPGQMFGLLGPNGAGKSSTFNMITGALGRTAGNIRLLRTPIEECTDEQFQEIGICPQLDFMWTKLSVAEHLRIFGMIKGLSGHELEANVRYYCEELDLSQHADKLAINLSGGNKRKLCVACALIGSPLLQFFDEPSSGVDPVGKRFLWDLLTKSMVFRGASSILTTHSMAEAESLCHKIVCIGTPQYLKARYGSGYKISLQKSNTVKEHELQTIIHQTFENVKQIKTAEESSLIYEAPTEHFKFSNAFAKLEELKSSNIIVDFAIYNTTLEQIFIKLVKLQKDTQNTEPSH